MRRALLVGVGVAIVVAGCGGGSMSETEYVESLNAVVLDAGLELRASLKVYEQIADPTLDDFIDHVERQLVAEYRVRDRFESFDPPDSTDEVNQIMVDALAQIIAVAEGLVDVADTVSSLEEIERTSEFAEYQGVNAETDGMCQGVQAKLNDLSDRPVIEDPWLSDLQRTVKAFLDCGDPPGTN
jgi:hypothetical protein